MSIRPTEEQITVLEQAKGGRNLKVKAYAGAGKTSTLQMLASGTAAKRCSYLAFNRDIAKHARERFPRHVDCRTVHSLAFHSVDAKLTARLNFPLEPPHELAQRFRIPSFHVPSVMGKEVEVMQFDIGRMIVDALGRFCRSAASAPQPSHIVVDEKIDPIAAQSIRESLTPFVAHYWMESIDTSRTSGIIPDVYLKVWALGNPRIDSDLILYDEAQDSEEITLSVLGQQTHAQIVYVGDPYQQIYEWRGAVNAMSTIKAAQCGLTQSFRFGPMVAILANELLRSLGESTPLKGQPTIGSIVVYDPSIRPPVDAILCRKNVTAIWALAESAIAGRRAAIRMDKAEIIAYAEGAEALMAGKRTFKPAAFSLFETWQEVRDYCRSVAGQDLRPIVELIEQYGPDSLRELATLIVPEASAEYVISTVHKAKGLEWGRVRIANDFRFKSENGRIALEDEETRLLYVAATRARHVLDISGIQAELASALANASRDERGTTHAR